MDTSIATLVRDLIAALKADNKNETAPFDTTGTVKRIEGGTAWVVLAGGARETPVSMTIACSPGDIVQVRVSGGRAWITGNLTAPPTDNEEALRAGRVGAAAGKAAEAAQETADGAEKNARSAEQAAADAATAAGVANEQALLATSYADASLGQLSVVESVVETLTWISEHAEYGLTEDDEVQPGKYYFTRTGSGTDADPYVYAVVPDTEGNPSQLGYYEITSIDESVSSYVSSHVALTDMGLFVQIDGSDTKVLLSPTDGVVLYGPTGARMATYGQTAQIGDPAGFHIEISGTELAFYQGARRVAYVSNNQLYITQSVVLQHMDIGEPTDNNTGGLWSWRVRTNAQGLNDLILKWMG